MPFTIDIQDIKVAVDTLAFAYHEGQLYLLLVERKYEPFAGQWVIPGGFVASDEELEDAAVRELREETNLEGEIKFLTQAGAYGKVDRDPRKRVISIAYIILLDELPVVKGESDAQDAKWWPFDQLPQPLAFDHDFILEKAINKLRYLVRDTDAGRYLLPGRFEREELSHLLSDYLGAETDIETDIRNLLERGILHEREGKLSYA